MSTKKPEPSDFRKILERIFHRHGTRQVFDAFARLAACALAAQTRETEYLEEAKRWEKEDMLLFSEALAALVNEMEANPFEDMIGGYYMEFALSHKGQQWNGEFHTPKTICDLMARSFQPSPVEGDGAVAHVRTRLATLKAPQNLLYKVVFVSFYTRNYLCHLL